MAQIRDGCERQTFVYDVHGDEQSCSIASGDVQSGDKVNSTPPQPSSGTDLDIRNGHFNFRVPLLRC
jgi:hypothetical protein